MSEQFDPNKPPVTPPTKSDVAKTAINAGAGSAAYTGIGASGALGVVYIAKRFGWEMSVEEAMLFMALATTGITPILRIAQSLFRQFLAHRGYSIP